LFASVVQPPQAFCAGAEHTTELPEQPVTVPGQADVLVQLEPVGMPQSTIEPQLLVVVPHGTLAQVTDWASGVQAQANGVPWHV
jgi:hypothetical protein